MLLVLASFVIAVVGLLLTGVMNLTLANALVLLALPFVFVYKLLGNRPSILFIAAVLGAIGGGLSAFWGYFVVPTLYYFTLWGWSGVVIGVIAGLLIPLQAVLFIGAAIVNGDAGVYVGKFLGGLCFGLTGMLMFRGAAAQSPWRWLARRKQAGEAA